LKWKVYLIETCISLSAPTSLFRFTPQKDFTTIGALSSSLRNRKFYKRHGASK